MVFHIYVTVFCEKFYEKSVITERCKDYKMQNFVLLILLFK